MLGLKQFVCQEVYWIGVDFLCDQLLYKELPVYDVEGFAQVDENNVVVLALGDWGGVLLFLSCIALLFYCWRKMQGSLMLCIVDWPGLKPLCPGWRGLLTDSCSALSLARIIVSKSLQMAGNIDIGLICPSVGYWMSCFDKGKIIAVLAQAWIQVWSPFG